MCGRDEMGDERLDAQRSASKGAVAVAEAAVAAEESHAMKERSSEEARARATRSTAPQKARA